MKSLILITSEVSLTLSFSIDCNSVNQKNESNTIKPCKVIFSLRKPKVFALQILRRYLMNEDRVRKLFYYLIRKKEPCVRKFEGLARSKILGISQIDLCILRLENCRKVESNDFSESELENVIHNLKNGKSRDTLGFIREIFKHGGNYSSSLSWK